jgi:hypothetical protein
MSTCLLPASLLHFTLALTRTEIKTLDWKIPKDINCRVILLSGQHYRTKM